MWCKPTTMADAGRFVGCLVSKWYPDGLTLRKRLKYRAGVYTGTVEAPERDKGEIAFTVRFPPIRSGKQARQHRLSSLCCRFAPEAHLIATRRRTRMPPRWFTLTSSCWG